MVIARQGITEAASCDTGCKDTRPEWRYFWFYFVFVNFIWIVVPSIVIARAASRIQRAVSAQASTVERWADGDLPACQAAASDADRCSCVQAKDQMMHPYSGVWVVRYSSRMHALQYCAAAEVAR